MSKIKVVQHFFSNLIEPHTSSFYLERRPRGKFLCYKEGKDVMAQMTLSKRSYQSLMRFVSSVQCQRYIDDNDVAYDQDDDGMVEGVDYCIKRRGLLNNNLPVVVKKEPAPFIMQIFSPL